MVTPKVLPEHRADVARYGKEAFLSVEKSIKLYKQLGEPGGDWSRWEWPRRLAALSSKTDVPEQLRLA